MGNIALSPICMHTNSKSMSTKLVFWDGTRRILKGRHIAGEIMFEFPDKMVCHAESFFINHPIPSLGIDDELMQGETYFVLPIDSFACNMLSASSLSALGSNCRNNRSPINFGKCPFEYIQGGSGRMLIKVSPELIVRLITRGMDDQTDDQSCTSPSSSSLCTTPELKKHYDQLVGSRDHVWSPKLETISEHKIRFSPCRFIGFEWKQIEREV